MPASDLALAAPILAAACWLLYRSFRRRGGPCAGCSGGGCCGTREAPPSPVVKLGRR